MDDVPPLRESGAHAWYRRGDPGAVEPLVTVRRESPRALSPMSTLMPEGVLLRKNSASGVPSSSLPDWSRPDDDAADELRRTRR